MQRSQPENLNQPSPQSIELLHLIVENLKEYAIFMTDADGVIVSWNPGVERLLGYTESEITGQPISVIFSPEDIAAGAPERELETARVKGHAEDKHWHQRKDGSRFWANGLVMPLKNDDETLRGYAKIMRDDTAQKLADNRLRESEEFSRSILESSADCIKVLDINGKLVSMNKPGLCIMEIENFSEFEGRFWADFWRGEEHEKAQNAVEAARRGKTSRFRGYTDTAKGNGKFWDVVVSPILDENGKPQQILTVSRDFSEQKRTEDLIVESNQRVNNIFDSITDAFFALDRNWNFTHLNRQSEPLLQRRREELLGKNIWKEFPAAVGTTFEKQYSKAMTEYTPVSFEEFYSPLDTWFEVRAYPSADGLSVYFHNIDDRKRTALTAQLLSGINETLAHITNTDEAMREAGRLISQHFDITHCAFVEIDAAAETARVKYDRIQGEDTKSLVGVYPMDDYVTEDFRRALTSGESVVINDAATDPRTAGQIENINELGLGSFINTPYVGGRELKFVLGIYRDTASNWREDEVVLLRELAARIWLTIERLETEKTLREAEERYRALIEATATTVWHAAPDGNLSFVGESWTQVSGQSVAEILQSGWLDALHPDDREQTVEKWLAALNNKTFYNAEFRVLTTAGNYKWFSASAVPVFDEAKNVREWVGINIDIDAARQAEIEILRSAAHVEESRLKLQTALKAGKMGSWELNLTTGEMIASDACKINYGRRPEDTFTYRELADSVFEEDRERWRETVAAAIEACTDFEIEYRVYWKDCSVHWVLVRGNCFADDSGKTNALAGVSIDITERKVAEEKLRESESKFSALAEFAPQLVWMANPDGYIFWYNQRWYDYTGLTPADLEGWGWQQVHDPEMLDEITERWKMSIVSGEPFDMEFPLRGADGNFRWFLTRVNPLRNDEGKIVRWFGTNTDIEELRQTRIRAEQANQLKDEFLATLSHELRTPLNAILGWSQMLQSHQFDEAERTKALSTIERSARAQNQLIDDLLDVSRIITGKLRLDVRAVDLSEIIAAAVDSARPAAEAKNIRLQMLLDPQAGPISGDPDRLQQVIWNLLTNAVKFTPKEGRVQVRLERVNSHIEIVVSDTGKGIEPEFLPHVFDRFRQSDGSMTRRHGGLGLGLAIVRQLVELHGGTVSVTSDGDEQGAEFTISLPLLPIRREPASETPRVHPQAASHPARAQDCQPELSNLRILLVDDEADSRDLLNSVLSSCGAKVSTAISASDAFEKIKKEKFDILISDIGMPDEDGFSLIGKIRNLNAEEGGRIAAIALTAYARAEDRIKSLRSGFQMHIAKPVEPEELIAVVANLTERTRV